MLHPTSYPERERERERAEEEEDKKMVPHFNDKYDKVGKEIEADSHQSVVFWLKNVVSWTQIHQSKRIMYLFCPEFSTP